VKITDSFNPSAQSGFTFNELLVSMAIVVLAIMGYSLGSVGVIRQQTVSGNSTIAMHLAQDKIEELQARRILTDIDVCPGGGDQGISANGSAPGPFDRCWRIAPSALGILLREVDVTVSWRDYETHQVTLSTLAFRGR
jgi:prepilin-type N-terminal cleavage/methylation domain-containing protein